MNRYLAFDIEISKTLPVGVTDWKEHRPLGVSCAATLTNDGSAPRLWYSSKDGTPQPTMTVTDVRSLISYLYHMSTTEKYQIITWNGLCFDFDVLAEESQGLADLCINLAQYHTDLMFHFFCICGYRLSLDAAAKGMGLTGKTDGMNGAKAPDVWRAGKYQQVLEYVAQDVITTLDVALAVEESKQIRWTSKKGRPNMVAIDKWLSVRDAQKLPEPDTSWMDAPAKRSDFTDWMNYSSLWPSVRLLKYLQRVFADHQSKGQLIPNRDLFWLKRWLSIVEN
jgi:hypothetical protein